MKEQIQNKIAIINKNIQLIKTMQAIHLIFLQLPKIMVEVLLTKIFNAAHGLKAIAKIISHQQKGFQQMKFNK